MKQLQYYCGENIDCAIYTSLHNHDDSTPVRAKKGAHAPISRKKDDRLKTESQYGVLFGIYLGSKTEDMLFISVPTTSQYLSDTHTKTHTLCDISN